jgi:curved DNA-binding protein CbpA
MTLYRILGLSQNATKQEIKAAYYKLSKLYHPDTCSAKDAAKFIEINNAYSILSKATLKREYDLKNKPSPSYQNSPLYRTSPYSSRNFDHAKHQEMHYGFSNRQDKKRTAKDLYYQDLYNKNSSPWFPLSMTAALLSFLYFSGYIELMFF